ncbi:pimeloyl-ACP methyl ester carboxylesterase [Thermocatellispora tengchongensis]|uniref:Pimeloyl-ACP methyl ester carboxylesterase n=1 Tax=Thermocatellispora tengchongensis TaxID=1073253 RepID=A0A840NVR3_9ACTN|nr:alpha/beta fold hydrolase [Thermocatellispora tengchongensis]MBB5131312.1 pimeloyl-ACP methyl ester carboxylesterase [Thermocatellispora tengchongensis]
MSSTDAPRTYVLVHGSWGGGWVWSRLRPLLEAAGHEVHTPTLPGLGERAGDPRGAEIGLSAHLDDLLGYLEREGLERVTLVGHSYGGMVISGVAGHAPERVAALVYLDAFAPEPGQSCFDLVPWLPDVFAELAEGGGGMARPLDPAAMGVDDPGDAEWVRARATPMPVRTHSEPLPGPARPEGLPAMFVRCLRFPAFAETADRFRALGLPVAELDSHHFAQVSRPAELAELLLAGVPARTETTA